MVEIAVRVAARDQENDASEATGPIHGAGEAWGRSDGRDWAGREAPADGQNPTLPRPGRARVAGQGRQTDDMGSDAYLVDSAGDRWRRHCLCDRVATVWDATVNVTS